MRCSCGASIFFPRRLLGTRTSSGRRGGSGLASSLALLALKAGGGLRDACCDDLIFFLGGRWWLRKREAGTDDRELASSYELLSSWSSVERFTERQLRGDRTAGELA